MRQIGWRTGLRGNRKYTELLEAQFEAHKSLTEYLGAAGEEVALTPEQLEALRSLGYIR